MQRYKAIKNTRKLLIILILLINIIKYNTLGIIGTFKIRINLTVKLSRFYTSPKCMKYKFLMFYFKIS